MAFGLGESVGTAYVRIVADGTGLDKDIKDELQDAIDDAHLKKMGKDGGRDLGDGLNEGFAEKAGKGPTFKKGVENLNTSIARQANLQKYFDSRDWHAFVKRAEDEFGDVGFIAAKQIEEEFIEGARDVQGIEEEQLRFTQRIQRLRLRAAAELADEEVRLAKESADQRAKFERDLAKARSDEERDLLRDMEKTRNQINGILRRSTTEIIKGNTSLRTSYESVGKTYVEVSKDIEASYKVTTKKSKEAQTDLQRFADKTDVFGDKISKMFGAGSRNDFLNIFGKMVGLIPKAVGGLARLGETAQQFGKQFMDGFHDAAESGLGFFKSFGAGISKMGGSGGMGALAGGLIAAAGAIVLLEAAASTASLAVGGLSAVIGTLGSGLIGSVGLLTASLVPLVAGIGSVVVAWKALREGQQMAFMKTLEPLTNAFGALGDIAGNRIFGGLGDDLSKLTPFMNSLAEATENVSNAVRSQIETWVQLVNSGAFNSFRNTIASDLPGQIESLNRIFQSFATIFTGFFRGISPVLSVFLNDLERVTRHFSDWINSAKGNKAVTNFFSDALESVEAIGSALVSAGRLLGNFFRLGAQGGGDDLFRDLANTFDDWNESLKENEDSVKAWISDGADFIRVLGEIVEGVVDLIAALDHPVMRTVINGTLAQIALSFKILAGVIEATTSGLDILIKGLQWVGDKFGWVGDKLGITNDKGEEFEKGLGGWNHGLELTRDMASRAGVSLANMAKKTSLLSDKQLAARHAARDQARAFIDVSESADKAKVSLTEWIKIMQDQAQALSHFADNLVKAADRGVRKGLLAALKELGPEGARRVQQLANATDAQIKRANQAYSAGQEAIRKYAQTEVPPKKITVETQDALTDLGFLQGQIDNVHGKEVPLVVTTTFRYANKPPVPGAPGVDLGAAGGLFDSPTPMLIGEAGPEALVPLRRPLSMVDPAVRSLSAFAQGLSGAVSPNGSPGKTFNVGPITINTPTDDPRAVAVETVNRLALVGGF